MPCVYLGIEVPGCGNSNAKALGQSILHMFAAREEPGESGVRGLAVSG